MRFKKTAATLLSCALTFAVSANALAASFTDISGHWAEDTIIALADGGVVNGVTETEFQPDEKVTRAEFLKMVMNAVGIETVEYRYGECLEVKSDDWFAPYVQSALDKGIMPSNMITGYTVEVVTDEDGSTRAVYGGAFNGILPITREEMAVMTQYMYQYTRNANTMKDMEGASEMPFTDVGDISGWAYETVKLAYAQGFIDGMDDGTFSPTATATRAQAAIIISRLMAK
ncbi:MAG: S-layer homology domain-containing protein [Firmicutes bacterium]|nr:S-layer homology domain-containing protein [Bacillota bacterium]